MAEWIEHKGSVCPVLPEQRVGVLFRNGETDMFGAAHEWNWRLSEDNETHPYVITHYCVIE